MAAVSMLCCLTCSLPGLSFVVSPPIRPLSHHPCAQNGCIPRASLNHFGTRRQRRDSRARGGGCFLRQRAGIGSRRRIRRWDWAVRSEDLPRGVSSSRDAASDQEDDVLSFEEFEKALLAAAPSRGGLNRRADGAVDSPGAPTGINWRLLVEDILVQPLFLGIFAVLAKPAIHGQVKSSLSVTLRGACVGILWSLPLFAYGLFLETRRDWRWVRKAQATTERAVFNLFGSKRQVTKVAAVSISLSMIVSASEECGFRGFLPLILATHTSLPTASIVVLSGIFCGVLHAVSSAYFLNATLNGIFFHCLLLSTGNIFVPIVAHAVHNAFALIHCHLKTSGGEPAK
ncbi:unnamed protein product [Ectocarpus sp. 12 AP-2014]